MVEALFEAGFSFLLEFLLNVVFYWPGWLFLQALTFGRYPPPQGEFHNKMFVAVTGLALLLVLLTLAIYFS